mmetsp:Transcript_129547/g.242362  ORF Transcript_129547/g.242362 Transcript_129547/m.242362 type:complete len:278 (-) Transcript_129547:37-870(-)
MPPKAAHPTTVDWDAVEERLPIKQVPEAMAERKALFKILDPNKNGYLTLTEVTAGLPGLLSAGGYRKLGEAAESLVPLDDFRPACKLAYKQAHKVAPSKGRNTNQIGKREFHALLVSFRLYLELDVLFQFIDQSGDDRLCWKEVERHKSELEAWGIDEESARRKFPDDWEEAMKYSEFAEWCIARRYGNLDLTLDENDPEETLRHAAGAGNAGDMLKAFKAWDKNENGKISKEELAEVLYSLDSRFTSEQVDKLFEAADTNTDGDIDYLEFTNWIIK